MDVFELAAKLTLDSSEYERGIESAKNAASAFGKGLTSVVAAVTGTDQAVNNAADSAENFGESVSEAADGASELVNAGRNTSGAVKSASDSMSDAADSAENLSSSADEAADSVENVEEAAADTTPKISLFDRTIQALQDRLGELQEANEALGDDFGVLGRAIEAVKQPFNAVGELFGKLKNKFIEFAGSAKETAENGINNIIIEFNLLKLKAEPLIEQFGKLKTKFIDLMASGKALAESGINKIFDGVKTASEKLSAVFDKVKNQFVSVADSARKFAEGALNNIKIEFNLIAAKAAPLIAQFDKLKSKIGELISSGKNLVESSINKIKNGFNSVVDSARKLGERGFNSIQIGLINVALKVAPLVGQFDKLKSKISDLTAAGKTLVQNGLDKIKSGVDTVKSKFDVFKTALDKAKSKIQEVTDKGKDLAEKGFNKIQSGIEKVKSKFEPAINAFSKAKSWLEKLKDRFKKVGDEEDKTSEKTSRFGDIVKGVLTADAIKAGLSALWSGVKQIGQAFINIGKQAVEAYGNYEQLVGGVETLFDKTSAEVKKVGAKAIKALSDDVWDKLGEQTYKNAGDFIKWENSVESSFDAVQDAMTYGIGTAAEDMDGYLKYLQKSYGMNAQDAQTMADAVSKAIKSNINDMGDYAKNMAGIKSAADIVKENAANAFKTAGMSANEYMEMVTSFSASLLQGLGGDTAKAAKIADVAISDMSDNANKMGTDMQSIQNAYQGFSKQNYTMLDNLKLGRHYCRAA